MARAASLVCNFFLVIYRIFAEVFLENREPLGSESGKKRSTLLLSRKEEDRDEALNFASIQELRDIKSLVGR
jgi:hypothetical protein